MKLVRSGEGEFKDALVRGKYGSRRRELGGERLAAGLWELLPGKVSWPLHAHLVTEEALFVVAGHGVVRTPEGEVEIGPGDYVSFPAGGPAHQLRNPGSEPLVYLGLSAAQGVDVVQYPDSGKLAASVGTLPARRRWMFREGQQVDYLDGEE
jgi:uncharacterized cupin superfamily protein